jgi:dTDP-4-dehydrorhamnose reductase
MVARARRGERLKVVNDSFGTPTYAVDLANRIYDLVRLDLPGVFHIVNSGAGASFAEFAQKALENVGLSSDLLQSVRCASLERRATRPQNSRLRCVLSEEIGLEPLPSWQDALKRFITEESLSQS